MKKWLSGILFFVVVYLFFVIVNIPAQWAIKQAKLPDNIVLQGVKGTVWNTDIDSVIVNGYDINQVNSKVSVWSLLALNPSIDITFGGALVNGPEGKATLTNLLDNLTVTDATLSVLANDIAKQLVLPVPLTAKKYLDLSLTEFVMGAPVCAQLNGELSWDNASISALDQKVKLGSLKAELSCEKGQALIKFDPKNDLGLSLSVNVQSPERVSGNGYLKPGKKFPSALREVLPFLGNPDAKGRYKLSF